MSSRNETQDVRDNNQASNADDQIKQLGEEIERSKQDVQKLEEQHRDDRAEVDQLRRQLVGAQRDREEALQSLETTTTERESLRRQLGECAIARRYFTTQLEDVASKFAAAEFERQELQGQLSKATEERDQAVIARNESQQRAAADADAAVAKVRETMASRVAERESTIASLTKQKEKLEGNQQLFRNLTVLERTILNRRKRKRDDDSVMPTLWMSQVQEVSETLFSLNPDPAHELSRPDLQLVVSHMLHVIAGEDGDKTKLKRLNEFRNNASTEAWFCLKTVVSQGWQAASPAPKPCSERCIQIKRTEKGLAFRVRSE